MAKEVLREEKIKKKIKQSNMEKLIFKCTILNDEGVIEKIGVYDENSILDDASGSMHYKVRDKQELIDVIQTLSESEIGFEMVTDDGTEVILVDEKYFRTDGDKNQENDLLDLMDCSLRYPVYLKK